MTEAERERAAIVAWLREEGQRWSEQTASYRAAGNNGPYLGAPSYRDIAHRIERGDHLPDAPHPLYGPSTVYGRS